MSITVKWGLITGMVYVIFSLVNNMLGIQDGGGFTAKAILSNAALFGATLFTIYLGIKEARDTTGGGFINFGQCFRTGMGITLITALVACAFTFIYLQFIDPGFIDKIMAMTEEQWEQNGMTEEQMDAARSYTTMLMTPWAFSLITILSVLFWGLVKSLIAGAFLKTEAPPTAPMA
ncbi:MAG TPA: DUF4199 domain-containing protein [Saprospiraceae bacterium]|nr:DUF4199 domain-containing protein [Saprospiraceae bacterium]